MAEAWLLEKYKDLVFHDPNYNQTYSIIHNHMEYQRWRDRRWWVVARPADQPIHESNETNDHEPYSLEVVCKLIPLTIQACGVRVVKKDNNVNDWRDYMDTQLFVNIEVSLFMN